MTAIAEALVAPLARLMVDARGRVVRWAGLSLVELTSFLSLLWNLCKQTRAQRDRARTRDIYRCYTR